MNTRYHFPSIALALIGCLLVTLPACAPTDEPDHDDDHDHESVYNLTYWDDAFEVLLAFEPHSSRVEGTLYLSTPGNQPHPADELHLALLDAAGSEQGAETLTSDRDGVFNFEFHHGGLDDFYFAGAFQTNGAQLAFETNTFLEAVHYEDTVHMPKEQQWLLNVGATTAGVRPVYASFTAPATVRVDQQYLAEISAPVAGHLDGGAGRGLPVSSGDRIDRGQRLATLAPSFHLENTGVERQLALLQAEQDYARAQRLREDNAISIREYELRKREFEAQQAAYGHFVDQEESGDTASLLRFNEHSLELLAPFDGVVGRVEAASGRTLDVGDVILTLYDPTRLWIDLTAYPEDVNQLETIRGISWRTGRSAEWRHLTEDAIARIAPSGTSSDDGLRRTLHVRLSDGENGLFPGQRITARIYHGASEGVLAVPETAVFDHDTHRVVFVQHEGDRFEERVVETGSSYDGWVEIRSGLEAGDRVVSDGVYAVHLASGNVQVDHSHDH